MSIISNGDNLHHPQRARGRRQSQAVVIVWIERQSNFNGSEMKPNIWLRPGQLGLLKAPSLLTDGCSNARWRKQSWVQEVGEHYWGVSYLSNTLLPSSFSSSPSPPQVFLNISWGIFPSSKWAMWNCGTAASLFSCSFVALNPPSLQSLPSAPLPKMGLGLIPFWFLCYEDQDFFSKLIRVGDKF